MLKAAKEVEVDDDDEKERNCCLFNKLLSTKLHYSTAIRFYIQTYRTIHSLRGSQPDNLQV